MVYDHTQHHFVVHTLRRSQLTQHCNALCHLKKNEKAIFISQTPCNLQGQVWAFANPNANPNPNPNPNLKIKR